MYKNVLQSIQDVEIWPELTLVLFFTVFAGIIIYVFCMNDRSIEKIKKLPLDEGDESINTQES